ncbi:MAG TPA: L-type lectin-domain containing protein [Verrucomicrobiae bacterium]|nr:L-type lectin-domain containing protein [Verrucomicrobiae bacterium]
MPNAPFELMALIGVALLGHQSLAAGAIYANFDSTTGLILQAHASPFEGKLRLSPAIPGQGLGGAWLNAKQPVKNGFETTFQIQITEKYSAGADGLAFVIQNNSTPALGYPGCNIGYGGITNLLAVKFNNYHWQDHAYGNDYGRYDLIAVLAPHSPTTPLWDSLSNTIAATTNGVNFSDGQIHTVKIVYVPGNLQVFLDDLENPLMTVYVNLAKVMNLDNGRAWVGFTAASGADWQNHDLISWAFESAEVIAQPGAARGSSQPPITNPVPPSPLVYLGQTIQTPLATPLAVDPSFGYRLPDGIGLTYPIEVSTDLVEWTPLTNALFYFRDPESTNYPQRFYRFRKN